MQNLNMQTPNITSKNIENIAKLFPNTITEKEENWKTIKAIDFDLLKQQLSKELVEDNEERYTLNWPWKKASLLKANTPIEKTLRPCREDSVNFDTTENLYLEWDNFEVLKILQESYLWKIKMIYIDPPYNTGKDFVYKDNFKKSKDEYEDDLWTEDEEGWKLFKNTDTNGRFHSDWLSMMYERLTVARDLLKDDWVIFMSIDDNEVHNLRKIADEVFGEENFESMISWRRRSNQPNDDSKMIAKVTEYILVYAKNSSALKNNKTFYKLPLSEKRLNDYTNPDNDIRWEWSSTPWWASKWQGWSKYEIITPKWTIYNEVWLWNLAKYNEALKNNLIIFPNKWEWKPRKKIFKSERMAKWQSAIDFWINWLYWDNLIANSELKNLFWEERVFDFQKPTVLIKKFLKLTTKNDDIILDFFSGSATTADAVMNFNREEWNDIKYICVQLKEETDEKSEAFKAWYKNICEIWKERIRRSWKKIIEENKEELEKREIPLDTWFRVYKTDSSNMKDVFYHPNELEQWNLFDMISNIKEDRSSEDLLTQVILDLGLTLDMPIEKKEILGNDVYFVAWNSLVACFDKNIDFGIVDEIAKNEPLRVVFRDSCFKTDSDRINFENRFKKLSGESDIRVI